MTETAASTRAVVASAFGGPEVLSLVRVPIREPGPDEVLLDVRAAALNPADLKFYNGVFGTDPASLPIRLGLEVSGVVAAVGPDVSGLSIGDEVVAQPVSGGYADQVIVAAGDVFAKPTELTFEQASGLLVVGGTAAHLVSAANAGRGDTVLLHGAGGGVGLVALQLLLARGARVIGTSSSRRLDELRALGAEPVVYGDGLADRVRAMAPDGIDVALDTVGTDEAVDVSVELVADRSRIATIAAFARAPDLGILSVQNRGDGMAIREAARSELLDLVRAGKLHVFVDRTFPLAEVRAAHEYLGLGHAAGKVVLVP
jgi:NADPH2:quinone reductase